MSDQQRTETAPTTDCPACGRTAKECNDGKAKGWDNCCQTCDAAGHVATHRLRAIDPGPTTETGATPECERTASCEPGDHTHSWPCVHAPMGDQQNESDGTTWRYAITRESAPTGDWYAIREVYTHPDGSLSWSEEPVTVGGDTWLECGEDWALMGRAVNAPILDLTLDPPAWVGVIEHRRDLRSGPAEEPRNSGRMEGSP